MKPTWNDEKRVLPYICSKYLQILSRFIKSYLIFRQCSLCVEIRWKTCMIVLRYKSESNNSTYIRCCGSIIVLWHDSLCLGMYMKFTMHCAPSMFILPFLYYILCTTNRYFWRALNGMQILFTALRF